MMTPSHTSFRRGISGLALLAALCASAVACKRSPHKKPPKTDRALDPGAAPPAALFLATDRAGRTTLFQTTPGLGMPQSVKGADHGTVRSAVVSADGRAVATLLRLPGRRELRVLGPHTHRTFRKLDVEPGRFDALRAVSGDGRTVVWQKGHHTLAVWQTRRGKSHTAEVDLRPLGELTYGVALSADGSRLAFSTFEKSCSPRNRNGCAVHLYGVTLGGAKPAPQAIVKGPAVVSYNPQFTRVDGGELLYMSNEGDRTAACRDRVNHCRYELRTVSFRGGKSIVVVSRGTMPVRAANGTLTFRRRLPDATGRLDWNNSALWIQPRGKKARQVLSGDVALRYHHVSPRGRWILLHRRVHGRARLAVYAANGSLVAAGILDNRSRSVGWVRLALPAGKRQLRRSRPVRRLEAALALIRKEEPGKPTTVLFGVDSAARLKLAPGLRAPATLDLMLAWLTGAAGRTAVVSRTHYCTLVHRVLPPGGRLRVLGTAGIAGPVDDPGVGLVVVRYTMGDAHRTGAPAMSARPVASKPAPPQAANPAPDNADVVTFDGRDHGGGVMDLVGVELPPHARIGQRVQITLTWRVRSAPTHGWQVFVHIEGQFARVLGDHVPGLCGADGWKVGAVLRDTFDLELTTWRGLLPGVYDVYVGWFRKSHRAVARGRGPIRDHRAKVARITISR